MTPTSQTPFAIQIPHPLPQSQLNLPLPIQNPTYRIPPHHPFQVSKEKKNSKMKVYSHPASSPTLHAALRAQLPYSVALLYRTQHGNRTADAHVLSTLAVKEGEGGETPRCWAAAYLDRSSKLICLVLYDEEGSGICG